MKPLVKPLTLSALVPATMLPTEVIVPLVAAGLISVLAATLVPRLRRARVEDHGGGETASR